MAHAVTPGLQREQHGHDGHAVAMVLAVIVMVMRVVMAVMMAMMMVVPVMPFVTPAAAFLFFIFGQRPIFERKVIAHPNIVFAHM